GFRTGSARLRADRARSYPGSDVHRVPERRHFNAGLAHQAVLLRDRRPRQGRSADAAGDVRAAHERHVDHAVVEPRGDVVRASCGRLLHPQGRARRSVNLAESQGNCAMTKTLEADFVLKAAEPLVYQHAAEIQPYGHIVRMPIALSENVCKESVENLNQLLADTMTLRDLYKKHHWQLAGPTFYQLHLLFDKHYGEQDELVDAIAERIQVLGGVS